MAYTTQSDVAGYLGRELTEAEITYIKSAIEAVDDYIDVQTQTTWRSDGGNKKIYEGGEEYVFIDPVTEIDLVEALNRNGDVLNVYDTSDWQAYPLNGTVFTSLRLRRARRWPLHAQIRVTGTWGQGDVPADIRLAATILVSDWIVAGETNLLKEDIEGYSRFFVSPEKRNPQVEQILQSRRRVII